MDSHLLPTPSRSQYFWLALALLLLTVYGSLIPLQFTPLPWEEARARFRQMSFYDPRLAEARGDWAVNMVQYAALSLCFLAALAADRRWVFGWLAAAAVVPAGCGVALATEFLQGYFPPRTVPANDLLVECLGTLLG